MKVLLESQREWETIRDPEKIRYLTQEKIKNRAYFLKHSMPPSEFVPGVMSERGIVFAYNPETVIKDNVTLFITLNRHVEIDFRIEEITEPGTVLLYPLVVRIGKAIRSAPRIMTGDGDVYAANFQVSRSAIEVDNTKPQITNKVIFSEFERAHSAEFPGLRIYDYAERERPMETILLNKKSKPILLEDINGPDGFAPLSEEFEDYGALLLKEGRVEEMRKRYTENYITSLLSVPILYTNMSGDTIPIAFMYLEARGDVHLTRVVYEKWKAIIEEILLRIVDANTVRVKEKQKVMNVSEGGAALEITNEDLKKFIPQRKWITFDLIFKLQAPLRFQAKLCHVGQMDGSIVMGVDLQGTGHSAYKQGSRDRLKTLIRKVSAG